MMATYTVSNLLDAPVTGSGSAPGTLRQTIYDANHSDHSDDPDIIQFADGLTGDIYLSVADDLSFGPSALAVTSKMSIQGNGLPITIKRDPLVANLRLIIVAPGAELTIDSLMFSGGVAQGVAGTAGQDGGPGFGGALLNQGVLSIRSSTLYDNSAIGGFAGAGGTGGLGYGGAIYNGYH